MSVCLLLGVGATNIHWICSEGEGMYSLNESTFVWENRYYVKTNTVTWQTDDQLLLFHRRWCLIQSMTTATTYILHSEPIQHSKPSLCVLKYFLQYNSTIKLNETNEYYYEQVWFTLLMWRNFLFDQVCCNMLTHQTMNWKADKEYTKWAGKYTTTPTYLKHVQKPEPKSLSVNTILLLCTIVSLLAICVLCCIYETHLNCCNYLSMMKCSKRNLENSWSCCNGKKEAGEKIINR